MMSHPQRSGRPASRTASGPTVAAVLLWAVLAVVWVPAEAAPADGSVTKIYALVVGASDYVDQSRQDLPGARNDATLLERTLNDLGAARVVLLRDRAVTRKSMRDAWYGLIREAGGQGLLVFAYAGHGDRFDASNTSENEQDGRDDFLLLPNWRDSRGASAPGVIDNYTENVIVDNELRQWIRDAAPNTVLVIMDACHSGSMTRAYQGHGRRLPSRDAVLPSEVKSLIAAAQSRTSTTTFGARQSRVQPHEVFLGAADDQHTVNEIVVSGSGLQHGALSVAAADALRGAADADRDGSTSRAELFSYVTARVRSLTYDAQQPKPDATPPLAQAVWRSRPGAVARSETQPLRVAMIPRAEPSVLSSFPNLTWVSAAQEADLVWDLAKQQITRRGDVIRVAVKSADQDVFKSVVVAQEALASLRAKHAVRALDVKIANAQTGAIVTGTRLRIGTQVVLEMDTGAVAGRFVTAFNVASDGQVQPIIPSEAPQCAIEESKSVPNVHGIVHRMPTCSDSLQVAPPAGADVVVTVVSAREPVGLRRALRPRPGGGSAGSGFPRLAQIDLDSLMRDAGEWRVGFTDFVTDSCVGTKCGEAGPP